MKKKHDGDWCMILVPPYYCTPGGVGCAKHPVRDLAARVVVLEERWVPEAPSEAGSAGREGRAYVVLVFFYIEEY